METLESALELLLAHCRAAEETEEVSLLNALGRVAAEDVVSPINVPPFDRSPLDGYALHSEDIENASKETPASLRVIGEACAGCGTRFDVARGEALRVMTGAPVPPSCNCVIRQEDTDEGMDTARMYAPVGAGKNVCYAGEDIPMGTTVLRKGEVVTAAHVGALASVGVAQLKVARRVRAALLCTGDELEQPGKPLTFGKIYDANRMTLTARLTELGVEIIPLGDVEDEPQEAADKLLSALAQADVVLTTGGVSVGKKDIMHKVLPLMGAQRLFWKVAMKPGSPLLCGEKDGKLIICLSGNPFAALTCFELFAVPVLKKLGGYGDVCNRRSRAVMKGRFGKKSPGRRLIRAYAADGFVRLLGENHSSGSLFGMVGCNCLIDIPAGTGALEDGAEVEIVWL